MCWSYYVSIYPIVYTHSLRISSPIAATVATTFGTSDAFKFDPVTRVLTVSGTNAFTDASGYSYNGIVTFELCQVADCSNPHVYSLNYIQDCYLAVIPLTIGLQTDPPDYLYAGTTSFMANYAIGYPLTIIYSCVPPISGINWCDEGILDPITGIWTLDSTSMS